MAESAKAPAAIRQRERPSFAHFDVRSSLVMIMRCVGRETVARGRAAMRRQNIASTPMLGTDTGPKNSFLQVYAEQLLSVTSRDKVVFKNSKTSEM